MPAPPRKPRARRPSDFQFPESGTKSAPEASTAQLGTHKFAQFLFEIAGNIRSVVLLSAALFAGMAIASFLLPRASDNGALLRAAQQQLNSLTEANVQLTRENADLIKERDRLTKENARLSRSSLIATNTQLTKENDRLSEIESDLISACGSPAIASNALVGKYCQKK